MVQNRHLYNEHISRCKFCFLDIYIYIYIYIYISSGRSVYAGNIVIEIFVTVTWDASVCMNPTSRGSLAHGIWLELGIHTGHLVIC